MISRRLMAMMERSAIRWPWPAERTPLTVNHVRYVKKPLIDPVSKAISMAKAMKRDDLVERLGG